MDNPYEGKCPDEWKDPMEELEEDLIIEFEAIIEDIGDDIENAFIYAGAIMGQYDAYDEIPDNKPVPVEHHILQHLVQQEYLLAQILKELRGEHEQRETEGTD